MRDVVLPEPREVPHAELSFSRDGGHLHIEAQGVPLRGVGEVGGRATSEETAEGVAF